MDSSGLTWTPCGRSLNCPSPNERRKLPSRSKTTTGCSLRLKAETLSLESTATPATSMNSQPGGSFSQFSTGSKSSFPLPTVVAILHLPPVNTPEVACFGATRAIIRAEWQSCQPLIADAEAAGILGSSEDRAGEAL